MNKTKTITKMIKEVVPWDRKPGVPDLHENGDDIDVKQMHVELLKGSKILVALGNTEADAIETYEVEIHDNICVFIENDKLNAKVVRKISDDPL